ncbi:MAG TPA: hypothetical protein VHJ20_09150 [Polyangia bacterium]|nr:hypothetical protein [Polyangia bacterium]
MILSTPTATLLVSLLLAQAAPPPPPPPPPRPISPAAAAALRASFADDPPLPMLRSAATALALAEPERAQSLVARARWAGLLPDVRIRVDRRFARTESLDLTRAATDPTTTPVGVDANNDLRYEFRATWELSRVVFNPDELGAGAHALRMADVRREIESAVIRVFFERRRLKAEALATDAPDTASGVRLELHVQELEAELDALTGGAFSRWRSSRHGDPPAGSP